LPRGVKSAKKWETGGGACWGEGKDLPAKPAKMAESSEGCGPAKKERKRQYRY